MTLLGLYTVLAAAALLGMALMTVRQYREQRQDSGRWREMAERLAAESARRQQAEAALRRAQTLEAVGQLTAGGIAHDFNNLLAVILNYAALARVSGLLPAGAVRDDRWTRISAGGPARGPALTRQLLAFSRGDQEGQGVGGPRRPERRWPTTSARCCAGTLPATIDARVQAIEPDAWPVPGCDPSEAEQALMNLAVNARDAMPEGGTLTVEAEAGSWTPDRSRLGCPGGFLALREGHRHRDDQEVRARAFEPFFTTKEAGRAPAWAGARVRLRRQHRRAGVRLREPAG